MPNRNTELETTIREYVQDNPGMTRSLIATNLQRAGVRYGKTHLSNRVGELVSFGSLSEQVTQDGRKLVFPPAKASTSETNPITTKGSISFVS